MGNIKKLTSISVFTTGEGKRIAGTYSEISKEGSVISQNNKFNFVVLDTDVLERITYLEEYVKTNYLKEEK